MIVKPPTVLFAGPQGSSKHHHCQGRFMARNKIQIETPCLAEIMLNRRNEDAGESLTHG